MPLRLVSLIMILTGLWMSFALAVDSSPLPCLMRPDHFQIRVPRDGFTWLDGDELSGGCGDVPAEKWIRNSSGSLDLFVYTNGPWGSGRYWKVMIGVARKQDPKPIRGVCLRTSTVGWRTLQRYKRAPLAWLDDLDKDGKAEFILWTSFPLRADASLAEYGVMAWVYRVDSENSLAIDWELSRKMAREIAEAYQSLPDSAASYSGSLRAETASALEQFVDERCSMPSKAAP